MKSTTDLKTVTRLFAIVLILALLAPAAAKAPTCYVTGRWPTYACMCGRVGVPMWVCKVRR